MPIFYSSEQFYSCAEALFNRVREENPQAVEKINKAKLLVKFECTLPEAIIVINGRHNPATITYGEKRVRPELEVRLSTDTLHAILLGDLKLSEALANKDLTVRGPVRKVLPVADLFHQCQAFYPEVLRQQGVLN